MDHKDSILLEDPEITVSASELMLGDFVKTRKGVMRVRSINLGGPIMCGKTKDQDTWDSFYEHEIYPIDIDSTVLEQNGFKEAHFERYELKNGDKVLVLAYAPTRYNRRWNWMISSNNSTKHKGESNTDNNTYIGFINYVHELQHVLHLL